MIQPRASLWTPFTASVSAASVAFAFAFSPVAVKAQPTTEKPSVAGQGMKRNALDIDDVDDTPQPRQTMSRPLDSEATPAIASNDSLFVAGLALSLKPQQMSSQWRQIEVGGTTESILMQAMMMGMRHGNAMPVYYTRGQIISVADQTYLVTYRAELDLEASIARRSPSERDTTPRLASDALLSLSLLNLRTCGNLEYMRAFNPATDIERASNRDARFDQQSVSNMKQLGLALAQYTSDWDEVLPSMKSAQSMAEIRNGSRPMGAAQGSSSTSVAVSGTTNRDTRNVSVQVSLMPYARDAEIFRHPGTKELYRPNAYLSHKNEAAIARPSQMVAFYEARPSLDGRRAGLYLDGHVKRELETDWPRLKKLSHLP